MLQLVSTRNPSGVIPIAEAIKEPLCDSAGIYVPHDWSALKLSEATLREIIRDVSAEDYSKMAVKVLKPWFEGWLDADVLEDIADRSWSHFNANQSPAQLETLADNVSLLNLTLGPSHAFKDFGMQFLAQLFRLFAEDGNHRKVLVATSGDTGAAAAAAFANTTDLEVLILYPHGRVSDFQLDQMAATGAANIKVQPVTGDFDDCQDAVKKVMAAYPKQFLAVNSINIGRLLAQVAYHFYSWAQMQCLAGGEKSDLQDYTHCIPSGNFGNTLSCWYAAQMGMPTHRIIAACNINDAIVRILKDEDCLSSRSIHTHSSAMDISIPSNAERLVFERQRGTVEAVKCEAYSCDDDTTLATINECWERYGRLIDPHTAVALNVLKLHQDDHHSIVIETAAPFKFPDVIELAGLPRPPIPKSIHPQTLQQRNELPQVDASVIDTAFFLQS